MYRVTVKCSEHRHFSNRQNVSGNFKNNMTLSDKEINLMDKILALTVENDWRKGKISEQLNISDEEYQFLIDQIVEFNDTHTKIANILDKGTDYQSIDNCFETKRFIDNGGFKKYFKKEMTDNEIADIILGDLKIKSPRHLIADILAPRQLWDLKEEQRIKNILSILTSKNLITTAGKHFPATDVQLEITGYGLDILNNPALQPNKMKDERKKDSAITKMEELIKKAEELPHNGFINSFREIKGRAEIILKNELGEDNAQLRRLRSASYVVNFPGKKLKAILSVALEEIEYLKKPKKTAEKKEETAETVKTYCCYCQKETNQRPLFYEFELVTQEVIMRNEQGDESQSMWTNVGHLWNLSKCLGCEKITFKHIQRHSPDRETDKTFYFPRKPIREVPNWIIKLPTQYLEILQEVYASVNEELYILSLTGIRTLLDVFIVNKIGDTGTFKQKIDKLVTDGIITSSKATVLETAIDAGNASAHRGYKPDKETLFKILDIVENLLNSEIVDRQVNQIKEKTPQRKK